MNYDHNEYISKNISWILNISVKHASSLSIRSKQLALLKISNRFIKLGFRHGEYDEYTFHKDACKVYDCYSKRFDGYDCFEEIQKQIRYKYIYRYMEALNKVDTDIQLKARSLMLNTKAYHDFKNLLNILIRWNTWFSILCSDYNHPTSCIDNDDFHICLCADVYLHWKNIYKILKKEGRLSSQLIDIEGKQKHLKDDHKYMSGVFHSALTYLKDATLVIIYNTSTSFLERRKCLYIAMQDTQKMIHKAASTLKHKEIFCTLLTRNNNGYANLTWSSIYDDLFFIKLKR